MTNGTTYWMQYAESSVSFISFTVKQDSVKVTGPLGAASYIDRAMPVEEARTFWAEQLSNGWHRIDASKAPSHHAHMAFTYGR